MRLVTALCVATTPVFAEMQRPIPTQTFVLDYLGGHGCTLGAESLVATMKSGFRQETIETVSRTLQAAGLAVVQGDYVVFDASVCMIRLPTIQSDLTVSGPFIQSITSSFDHYASPDDRDGLGCFLLDSASAFDERAGGERGAGFEDYTAFLAAGMIAGDLRFYGPSPIHTPIGFQVMTGEGCGTVPNAASVAVSHPYLVSGFGPYIRRLGGEISCDGGSNFVSPGLIAADIQNADTALDAPEDPDVNAWLFAEWDFIALAAGWHEGQSGTTRGKPRPPLCTYSPQ